MPYKDLDKRRAKNREYYHKHKDPTPGARYKKIKHNIKRYQEKHRVVLNKKAREYNKTEKGKLFLARRKPKIQIWNLEQTAKLTDGYLVKQLKKGGYTASDLKENPEIVSQYRIRLERKRKQKEFVNDYKMKIRIAENIKTLRKNNNFTLIQFAKATGVSRHRTVADWESGEFTPNLTQLIAIAKRFKTSLDFLVFYKIPKK